MDSFRYVNSVSSLMRTVVEMLFPQGGEIAVDATLGHGNDALYLSKKFKRVYAFEIQKLVVCNFKQKMQEEQANNIEVYCESNEFIDIIEDKPELIVYNLGYLPGGDKKICTHAKTTLKSIMKACSIVERGFIIIALYSGHEEGREEAKEVLNFASNLNTKDFGVMHHRFINRGNNPPELVVIEKR